MNRLILIGNGFDLAHGLKTNYNDFIYNYINRCFTVGWDKSNYVDDLIEIKRKVVREEFPIGGFGTLPLYLKYFHESGYLPLLRNQTVDFDGSRYQPLFEVKVKAPFLEHLLLNCRADQWVDIENEFYRQLKIILNSHIGTDKQKRLSELNSSLKEIINKLEAYLIDISTPPIVDRYRVLLSTAIKIDEVPLNHIEGNEEPKETYIVNFNYTNTIEQYFSERGNPNIQLNYIHGKLKDLKNRLVFGFGDELDEDYLKMEKEHIKGYFEYIKSFWYFKTSNYRKLIRFIDSEDFQVYIMGHSCGLSDRTMLNMIFQHPRCVSIKVFYYEKGDWNNFFDQTQEIARHFKDKEVMRRKIVSFDISEAMPQWDKK